MVNIPSVVAAFVSVYILLMTVAILYLTYSALKQDTQLSTGEAGSS
jgi:hypothetical protein